MNGKTIKTMTLSFLAGILLMGSFWLGTKNNSLFEPQTEGIVSSSNSERTSSPAEKAIPPGSFDGNDIAQMVELAGPAVVKIETEITISGSSNRDLFYRHFFGDDGPQPRDERSRQALGTGFIIDNEGHILTNHHVVDKAKQVRVNVNGIEKKFDAKVIGQDPELDLAVLQIETDKDLPVLKLGDSDQIQVGDWSVAIGNPYGLDHTVTVGVISAKQRPLSIGQATFKDLLQTDASINPGNSGGPLLNLQGEVIGINTAINAEGQGIGFAIPINTVQEVLEDLIHTGRVSRPWLGVSLQDMTLELAKYLEVDAIEGAVVNYVSPNSPAQQAGLTQGDIIIQIDQQKISTSEQLVAYLSESEVGKQHQLLIVRNGKEKKVTVTAGEKKYNQ